MRARAAGTAGACCRSLTRGCACREPHNAVTDAIKSMRLFNLHNHLRGDAAQWAAAQAALLATQQTPSFARLNPSFEGCCMGNRKTCSCGGTFFF